MKGKRKMKMASTRIWGADFLRGGRGVQEEEFAAGKIDRDGFPVYCFEVPETLSMSQANVDLIQSLYAAFARGDGPAVLASMDPAIVWNEAENFLYADRNPYVGHAAVAEGIFFRLATEWDHFQALPSEFLDAGDTVVVLGYYKATYKATGAPLNAQFAHIWRLRDAKITAFQQYTDTAQAARAVHG
jgi:ketosteroid isomerase-like protein